MANKKLNPRHIVVDKRTVDLDAIVDEAMKDDMRHARLLVGSALLQQEQMPKDEIQELMEACGEVDATERNIRYAERLMRSKSRPRAKLDEVSTAADLKKLKTNMKKLALHTALCSVCLGLRKKRFSEERLGRIFDDVGSTRTKIENGEESYEELERRLENV